MEEYDFPYEEKSSGNNQFLYFDKIDSTNSWAKRNVRELDPQKTTLIIAKEQSDGRGRFNRSWKSPRNVNMYVSLCLFFPAFRLDFGNIGQVMAVSIAQVLTKLRFTPSIKWPNDVCIGHKKVGGILCETAALENGVWLIVGVGLNINMKLEDIEKINENATSMLAEQGREFNVDEVIQAIHQQFKENFDLFLLKGFTPFIDMFQFLVLAYPVHKITFSCCRDNKYLGTIQNIDEEGALHLLLETGEVKKFSAGEIIHQITNHEVCV